MSTKTLAIFDAQTQTLDLSLNSAAANYQRELQAILKRIGTDSNVVFHLTQEGIESTFLTPVELPKNIWENSPPQPEPQEVMFA